MNLDPLVQEYIDESESSIVIFTEFATNFKKDSNDFVYCFYEGKDDNIYYNLRVENLSEKTVEWFNCNGKEKVIDVYEMIFNKNEYNNKPLLFFVDTSFCSPS